MKKLRIIAFLLAIVTLACVFAGCRREEEESPLMPLNAILAIADEARDVPITYFSDYEYVILGSSAMPLYYFQLKELDFAFSITMNENGEIDSMMLSHVSGEEIYLFHKTPGILDPNATQYTEDAKSYDLQQFIDKMTEN
ncbi:MAG: hypothetical protein J6S71_02285 [Clostridia bacterium]|nr:hypothetical protein [Clostridia bacterium]